MLIEFSGVIMVIVSIVIAGSVISAKIDKRYRDEVTLHGAVKDVFYEHECNKPARCSQSAISVRGLKEVKIRKPSKGFNKKDAGGQNGVLEDLYGELEKASKGGSGK